MATKKGNTKAKKTIIRIAQALGVPLQSILGGHQKAGDIQTDMAAIFPGLSAVNQAALLVAGQSLLKSQGSKS